MISNLESPSNFPVKEKKIIEIGPETTLHKIGMKGFVSFSTTFNQKCQNRHGYTDVMVLIIELLRFSQGT